MENVFVVTHTVEYQYENSSVDIIFAAKTFEIAKSNLAAVLSKRTEEIASEYADNDEYIIYLKTAYDDCFDYYTIKKVHMLSEKFDNTELRWVRTETGGYVSNLKFFDVDDGKEYSRFMIHGSNRFGWSFIDMKFPNAKRCPCNMLLKSAKELCQEIIDKEAAI